MPGSRHGRRESIVDNAVAIENLRKSYGEVEALRGVTLDITEGEMFALVGPDGAGKTSLLRILSGSLQPDSGTIRLLGHPLPAGRKAVKATLGYLSQGFSLYRDLSVEENLRFFADVYGVRDYKKRRDRLLGFTRLDRFTDRLAGRLSGGMKKKLALACALIHEPRLLLLDEPTTGVDPVSRRDFWLLLGELLAEGLTIVVTSPYLDEAERCSRVGLLRQGEFLFVGTPEDARESLSGSMVELLCDDPRQARNLIRPLVGSVVEEVFVLGDRLTLRILPDQLESLESIRTRLRDRGIRVVDLRHTTPTLENVYLSLVSAEGGTP